MMNVKEHWEKANINGTTSHGWLLKHNVLRATSVMWSAHCGAQDSMPLSLVLSFFGGQKYLSAGFFGVRSTDSITIPRLGLLHCVFQWSKVSRCVSPRIIYDSSGSTGERSKVQALKANDVILWAVIPALMCTSNAPLEMFNLTSVLIVPTLSKRSFLHPSPWLWNPLSLLLMTVEATQHWSEVQQRHVWLWPEMLWSVGVGAGAGPSGRRPLLLLLGKYVQMSSLPKGLIKTLCVLTCVEHQWASSRKTQSEPGLPPAARPCHTLDCLSSVHSCFVLWRACVFCSSTWT